MKPGILIAVALIVNSAVFVGPISKATASTLLVTAFGDSGWRSDDTRTSAGVDLVGTNNTNAPKPGQTPTAIDDALIAAQIQFVTGPTGSTYGGAVSIDGTAAGGGKSSFSVIDPVTGFDAAANLLTTFTAEYEMYKQHTGGGSTPAFKLGIQSTDWGTSPGESQNGFTAIRSGESAWDLILVHVPVVVNNVWTTITLDHDTGTWFLFDQATNAFFTPPGNALGADKTLDGWNADAIWGPKLFGSGAVVSSIQFGLGSGQPIAVGYVDYLQTNLLNGGDVVDFSTPVPEPASMLLLGTGLAGLVMKRRRRVTKVY